MNLMDGVEIIEVVKKLDNEFLFSFLLFSIIAIAVVCCFAVIFGYIEENKNELIFGAFLFVVSIVLLFLTNNESNKTHLEYKVKVDNTANFEEFRSKYNIISTENNMYTITLKEE